MHSRASFAEKFQYFDRLFHSETSVQDFEANPRVTDAQADSKCLTAVTACRITGVTPLRRFIVSPGKVAKSSERSSVRRVRLQRVRHVVGSIDGLNFDVDKF